MEKIFDFIYPVAFISFLAGLIRPSIFTFIFRNHATRKIEAIVFGLILLISLFTTAMLTPVKLQTKAISSTPTPVSQKKVTSPTTTPQGSNEKKIEAQIRSVVSSDIIKDVQVTKQYIGGYSVMVSTNEPAGLSDSQTKTGIWMDMGNIYTSIYKQPIEVNQAAIVAYMDTVDKYGKTSSEVVLKTSLDKSEAQKVNWNEVQSTLDQDILPNVWSTDINKL